MLTTWDHTELMDRLSRKLELVTGFCALHPPIFAGFDLTDETPMRLYVRAATNMAEHMRRAYALWPNELSRPEAMWHGKNVQLSQPMRRRFLER